VAKTFKISVLISGGGTTLKNLLDLQSAGKLNAEIVNVVSSSSKAGGNQFATDAAIPLQVRTRKSFESDEQFSAAIFGDCRSASSDLVVMGGFLKRVVIPDDFRNRVINIHPSLIPSFCGQGLYGMRVHQAVIDYGCKVTGCTVHFVDDEYDHGPVIAQQVVEVHADDSAEKLQQRVFAAERQIYPEVINLIASGRLEIKDRLVVIR